MIEVLPKSSANVLGVEVGARLTDGDYSDVWLPKLEELLERFHKVRLLLYMNDTFAGWEAKALWDDMKFGLTHIQNMGDLEKMAIVGGPAWVARLTSTLGHLVPGEFRSFSENKLDEAWTWVAN